MKPLVPASLLLITGATAWLALDARSAPPRSSGANQPPVCCFEPTCQPGGQLKTVKCAGPDTTVTLDGSGSFDPEGRDLTYFWQSCPGSTIDDPTLPITTLHIDTSASCSKFCGVRLFVSDGENLSSCRLFVEVVEAVSVCPPKPTKIEMTYTGEDCSASNFAQDPGSVSCSGDPAFADPVHIKVTMANQPSRVYFDGIVALGTTFEIDGAGKPGGKVPPNSQVEISDLAGNLLQDVIFHTSCSQPLFVGDQFGAVILTGFTP